jgi:hypothetical protein
MNRQKNRLKSQTRNGADELRHSASSVVGAARERTDRLVRDYPASSALTSFVLGCGLGLLTAWLLVPARRPRRWYEFDQPANWGRRFVSAVETAPQRIARRFAAS